MEKLRLRRASICIWIVLSHTLILIDIDIFNTDFFRSDRQNQKTNWLSLQACVFNPNFPEMSIHPKSPCEMNKKFP